MKRYFIILICVLGSLNLFATETVRIASYNIRICSNKTYYVRDKSVFYFYLL